MTLKTSLLAAGLAAFLLSACGDDEAASGSDAADTRTAESTKGLTGYAKELVREEGCDPDIAREMAPYESDYGECRMEQFLDTCGSQNKADGIKLISEIRDEGNEGLNPWLRACVRSQDLETSLNALCQARLRQNPDVCSCVAKGTLSDEPDRELVQWFAIAHAYDPNWQRGQYKAWGSPMSAENRFDDLEKTKAVFYGQLEACRS